MANGTHPVYFTRSKTGNKKHWGMFNFNANAQDTKVKYDIGLGAQITHLISGEGIFDMYFFLENDTPEGAVLKYHDIIGSTLLPPFWGMGWHQCKYGYKNTDKLKDVYTQYNEHDFPMDVLWSDIDHMLKYRDMTYDKNDTYKGLDTFIKDTLHANNRRYVPIIDAGVAIVRDGSYDVFNDGLKKDVFIKSGNKNRTSGKDIIKNMNGILYGKVWPGYAAFPDFTSQTTIDWWVDRLNKFYDEINYDGIWLDMNEVANFCTGPCIPEDVVPPEESLKSKLVYFPGGGDIEEKCLSIDGIHKEGTELNYHSLFGFLQGIATNKYFVNKGKRPFIIARSTFSGQGKYTSHWNGDNFSDWDYLKLSITGVINMNLYGINFNGADICGFLGTTTPELCQRWTNVGAFYPFARNHDDISNDGQEPYIYDDAIQNTMRQAIRWRYALLRYYYTQLYFNHAQGGMFWKPLFFEFSNEAHAYDDIERNPMIGPAIKLSPMLDNTNDKTQKFIFPPGVWCNLFDYNCFKVTKTSDQSLSTVPEQLNLHLRMGYIIPLQRNALQKVMNTVDLNALSMGLAINIDVNTQTAMGSFYADDGENLNPTATTLINFSLKFDEKTQYSITFETVKGTYTNKYTKLEVIEIMGASISGVKDILTMKIDGGEAVTGIYDKGKDCVTFEFIEPSDLTAISKIVVTK
jgi:alpha-glucosidase (family GH31 glycosyl hydrolase)